MKKLVIFASGTGSNTEKIMAHFAGNNTIAVAAVFCNNPKAGVIEKAAKYRVPAYVFDRAEFANGRVLSSLQQVNPDLIVLAGFLWKVPAEIVEAFPYKIINIHPALLPKFGGKGMFGMNVHRAVTESGECETGITIHYVDEHYDEGDVIFQAKVDLDPNESCESVSEKVRELELAHFPKVIESLLSK
ncbi:MAG: phosphoribosylglycinamide formyltransferase [Flavobacterium sp.]|nr:MAG: phosphoribosylglycinamide formyltransferase [Flavobacterium sp.]